MEIFLKYLHACMYNINYDIIKSEGGRVKGDKRA